MVRRKKLDWLLKPNVYSDEEVHKRLEEQARANAAVGGPVCPVCGKYLALHGQDHEFDQSSFT